MVVERICKWSVDVVVEYSLVVEAGRGPEFTDVVSAMVVVEKVLRDKGY